MSTSRLLTERQLDVLRGKQDRLLSKEIAEQLGISERAVERHLASIRERLGVSNVRAALQLAEQHGWLDSEKPNVGISGLTAIPVSPPSIGPSAPQLRTDPVFQETLAPFDYDLRRPPPERPVRLEVGHEANASLKTIALIIAIAAGVVLLLACYPKIVDHAQQLSTVLLNK